MPNGPADEAAPSAPQVRREGPSRDAPDAPPPLACGTLVKSDLPIVMWTFDPAAALGALSKSVGADAAAETDEPAPPSRSQKAERMVLGTPPRPPAPRRSATMSPNPAPYRSSSSRASKSAPGGPHAPRALASPPFHLPAAAAAAPCCRDGPAFRLLLVPSEWGSDGASLYLEALGNGATDAAAAPPQGGGGAPPRRPPPDWARPSSRGPRRAAPLPPPLPSPPRSPPPRQPPAPVATSRCPSPSPPPTPWGTRCGWGSATGSPAADPWAPRAPRRRGVFKTYGPARMISRRRHSSGSRWAREAPDRTPNRRPQR